jgi:arabinofuranan 3-O-arabinosyltransferase
VSELLRVDRPARPPGPVRRRLGRPGRPRPRLTEPVAYLAVGALVLLVLFLTDQGLFTPDTKPELYQAPVQALRTALSTWSPDPHLGQPNFDTGLAPAALAVAALRALGAEPWLAVRLWRALLLLAAGWGAARLFHQVARDDTGAGGGRANAAGRVTAAVLYVANPYVVVAGATTPILLPYAFLPWLLLALARSVRQPRSWRAPAAFALAFALCGGMNAGVVPLLMLLAVPCYLAYARHAHGTAGRDLGTAAGRCLALALLVSLYWLVPAALASASGAAIAATTETPRDVAAPSSWAETLRLLGLWTLYGRAGDRPFLPGMVAYLTNPLVLVASFAIPAAAAASALASRSRARALPAYLLAVSVPVMVGLFPPGAPSPFGRLLEAAFERVPGAIAFRTTNKAGALAALALTLLVALGAAELSVWLAAGRRAQEAGRQRSERMAGATMAMAVVLAVAVLPAWTGGLNLAGYRIPGYWRQAAADLDRELDQGAAQTRVLLLPGQVQADYRWGMRGPDDLDASLLTRSSVVRSTVPNGSREQANLLAALDVALATGAPDGTVSQLARYLGAGEVLARYDRVWEAEGGAPPSVLAAALRRDPDLRREAAYGRPGEHTVAPAGTAAEGDAGLTPLERWSVAAPRPVLRTEPAQGTVLIDGDGFALPSLGRLGLLRGQPPFRLLGSTSLDETALALDDGARIVLTDSNRRRVTDTRRAGAAFSPTLRADQPIQGPSLTLSDDPAHQSVTVLEGARAVTATSSGTPFGLVPWGRPAFAFDGDARTAWVTGAYRTAVGQSITIEFGRRVKVSGLTLRPVQGGPAQVSSVRVRLDGRTVDAEVPARPEVKVTVPETESYAATVEVTGVRGGAGLNPVGFHEIDIPGVRVAESVRMPERLRELAASLDKGAGKRLAVTPLDVVMSRAAGDPGRADDDEERVLDRRFWLPDGRSFAVAGRVAAGDGLPEPVLDQLAGGPGEVVASSSSRAFDSPGVRASAALDRDRDTAWVPAGQGPGEWIDLSFPRRDLDHLVVRQDVPESLKGRQGANVAVEAELSLDGGAPRRVRLRSGAARIDFPKRPVRRVRLTLTRVAGLGGGVRISEIDAGGAEIRPAGPGPLKGCAQVAKVDGAPLRLAVEGSFEQLAAGAALPVGPCPGEPPLRLRAGEHRLRAEPGWLVDLLGLSSTSGGGGSRLEPAGTAPAPPRVTVTSASPARTTLLTEAADGPYHLVLGQGWDARWRATVDGLPLGPPAVVDGYSAGWRIPDIRAHRIAVEFAPQRWAEVSLLVSLAGLGLVLVLLAGVGARQPDGRASPPRRDHAEQRPGRRAAPAELTGGLAGRGDAGSSQGPARPNRETPGRKEGGDR